LPHGDVWAIDLERNLPTRLTSNPSAEGYPIWSPDGSQIVFQTLLGDTPGLYQKAASGLGAEKLLLNVPGAPTDWSLDGRFIRSRHPVLMRASWAATSGASFKTRILTGLIKPGIDYDVTADGQR
jgi:Tol biopolymer transport system component